MILILCIVVSVFLVMEAWRARRNERMQLAQGGLEAPGDVYSAMRLAYPAAFAVMIGEGAWRGGASPYVGAGLVLFALSKALKWWAIVALGRQWTFRVIVVPGMAVVENGPYRFLRHPNYVAVAGELVAVAMMAGASVSGPIATVVFLALVARRIVIENRALDAILPRGSRT